jgi:hypothetical protein
MGAPIRGGKAATKAVKESFHVRVAAPDGQFSFVNASAYIGKEMPYTKPLATCALRVEGDVVSFSLLHLTKKTAATIASQPIVMPRGPLARLQRRAQSLEIAPGEIVVELNDAIYHLIYKVDDSGLATIDVAPGGGGGEDKDEDVTFDLPLRAVQMSLYVRSVKVDRVLAIGFIGHLGKPATPETVTRAAAMVLNSVSGMVEFRVLSSIETVKLPTAPSKWAVRPPVRKAEDRVAFELAVSLWTPDKAPVASGTAIVEVDLENANPTTGRLLYHITPSAAIEPFFGEYRATVDAAITDVLRRELGKELEDITYEVVLGEVDSGTLDRLREATSGLIGLDVTPHECRWHDPVAV